MFFSLVNHGLQGYFAGFKGEMAMARPCLGYYRHGKWLRSGLNSNEWLVSSLTRNSSKLPAKHLGDGCGICSLSERQEDKIKSQLQ